MSDIRIKVLKNGPYEVKGKVQLLDSKKAEFALTEETIYLCRCGQSKNKPFCDGTHNTCGFVADDAAR